MNNREQMQMTDTLTALQARGDKFTRRLLQEKQRVSQLEAQLKDVNKQVSKIREENKKKAVKLMNMHTTTTNSAYQRVDGLDPTRLAEINQKKLVSNLEGRLNKALVRQSSIQSENNLIKAKIDKLRRKVQNETVNRKDMEKRLKQIQDDVDDFMKRAAVASEQRDKIVEQRHQFMRENSEEREKFSREYSVLSSYIDEQNKLLEHSIAMVASDVVTKLDKIDEQENEEDNTTTNPAEEIQSLDNRIAELDHQYASNKRILQQTEEKNKSYKEAFRRLQEVSGLTSTESIIEAFVQNEEESFSLFNYIQTVNQECDVVLEERGMLHQEMDAYINEQEDLQKKRNSVVNNHKRKLEEIRDDRQRLKDASTQGKLTVLQIAKNVQSMYIKLRCRDMDENATVNESKKSITVQDDRRLTMFAGEQISERNILNHMEQIERRAIQIIAEYAKALAGGKRRVRRRPSVLLSPKSFDRITTANTAASKETYLSDDDDSDDDGSGNGRPVSVHDMRKQAAEKMKKPQTPETRHSLISSFFQ